MWAICEAEGIFQILFQQLPVSLQIFIHHVECHLDHLGAVLQDCAITVLAAGFVPVGDGRLLYTAMDLITSTPPEAGADIVPGSGISLFFSVLASHRDLMNSLQSCTLDKALAEALALFEGPVQDSAVWPLDPTVVDVDWVFTVNILLHTTLVDSK